MHTQFTSVCIKGFILQSFLNPLYELSIPIWISRFGIGWLKRYGSFWMTCLYNWSALFLTDVKNDSSHSDTDEDSYWMTCLRWIGYFNSRGRWSRLITQTKIPIGWPAQLVIDWSQWSVQFARTSNTTHYELIAYLGETVVSPILQSLDSFLTF